MENICNTNIDLVAFKSDTMYFFHDVYYDVFMKYLELMKIDSKDINRNMLWYLSTNYCMKREIMEGFVNFYYPSCLIIKNYDSLKFSWYHERVFNIFRRYKNYSVTVLNGLIHHQSASHVKNDINVCVNINDLGKLNILGI